MVTLIGIDCATKSSKIGLAIGQCCSGSLLIERVKECAEAREPDVVLSEWLSNRSGWAVLALDSPLGWPALLGSELGCHQAGSRILVDPNTLFRRETDRFIKKQLGKTPLDVGADRIARTAVASLSLLAKLQTRLKLKEPIPLAWSPKNIRSPRDMLSIVAIEVYPAATLVAHGLRSTRYKENGQLKERLEILRGLQRVLGINGVENSMASDPDTLDAVVCLAAAFDFVQGRAMRPVDEPSARKEGWIWVKEPSDRKC